LAILRRQVRGGFGVVGLGVLARLFGLLMGAVGSDAGADEPF
jgi:hypothetical protein